jgi:3-vinyl bacteriochlorophyllide hydratase
MMRQIAEGYSGLSAGTATASTHSFSGGSFSRQGRRKPSRYSVVDHLMDRIAPCPWAATAGSSAPLHAPTTETRQPLYTPEERVRRDATPWTLVQGVLAPVQFLVFLVSLGLVLNYLYDGTGYQAATVSVVVKTFVLYLIMVTGAIWEKVVFGKYLFARAFFWEDVFSMLVIALHTIYVVDLFLERSSPETLMFLALAAYATYLINAMQFIMKLRAARLDMARMDAARLAVVGAGAAR